MSPSSLFSLITHPARQKEIHAGSDADFDAFINSRTLEHSTKLEDSFVKRAAGLGVENGMVLDVGTRVGLIALKLLWGNENFFSIGVDASKDMVDRARETAASWGLAERAFFKSATRGICG